MTPRLRASAESTTAPALRDNSGRPVTLKQIAKIAGVSAQTVSCVVNETGSVSDEVRLRVREIARDLGYRPNRSAKAMRTGRSQILGLVISDIRNPFFPELAHEIEKAAAAAGYAILFIDTHGTPADAVERIASLRSHAVDGVITMEHSPAISQLNLPTVIIGEAHRGFDSVASNDAQGGYLLADHLLELGHRRVGLVTSPLPGCIVQRRDAFVERFTESGEIVWETYTPVTEEVTPEVSSSISATGVTAIVCSNDMIAVAVVRQLHDQGHSVPETISVVGFDDIPWASIVTPALTTIRQPYAGLAIEGVKLLLNRIAHPEQRAKRLKLDVSLIQRDTVSIVGRARKPVTTPRRTERPKAL